VLEVQYRTAWFIAHRIREVMRTGELASMGGGGGFVEADEAFIGREPGKPKKRPYHHKMKVLSLVNRATGQARSVVVDDLKPATVVAILEENIAKKARVLTDEGPLSSLRDRFAEHSGVRHRKEERLAREPNGVQGDDSAATFQGTRHGSAVVPEGQRLESRAVAACSV
jgi:ISXO2-like transposase domain